MACPWVYQQAAALGKRSADAMDERRERCWARGSAGRKADRTAVPWVAPRASEKAMLWVARTVVVSGLQQAVSLAVWKDELMELQWAKHSAA